MNAKHSFKQAISFKDKLTFVGLKMKATLLMRLKSHGNRFSLSRRHIGFLLLLLLHKNNIIFNLGSLIIFFLCVTISLRREKWELREKKLFIILHLSVLKKLRLRSLCRSLKTTNIKLEIQ